MALADDVTARIEEQLLIELTNKDSRTATTINTTLLALAVTDTEAAFTLYAETAYDSTDDVHVMLGVQGVIAALEAYTRIGHLGGESWDALKEELGRLMLIGTRARVKPQTDSPLTRTTEQPGRSPKRPWFDWPNLRHITPTNRGSDLDDDDEL